MPIRPNTRCAPTRKRRRGKFKTLLVTMLAMLLCQHTWGGPTSSVLDDAFIIGTNIRPASISEIAANNAISRGFKSNTRAES